MFGDDFGSCGSSSFGSDDFSGGFGGFGSATDTGFCSTGFHVSHVGTGHPMDITAPGGIGGVPAISPAHNDGGFLGFIGKLFT